MTIFFLFGCSITSNTLPLSKIAITSSKLTPSSVISFSFLAASHSTLSRVGKFTELANRNVARYIFLIHTRKISRPMLIKTFIWLYMVVQEARNCNSCYASRFPVHLYNLLNELNKNCYLKN